ncbi:VanW family protein [Paenibacillus methanolicus]|uniref:VanW like protein n=1 Tax=Paenibacillus methanolicus TaxID=582686 RepID=A0A5S5BT25_9BACL|nr:VanW family protein [Paenibacillus methanolicus]TYP70199.1 VanW like protein [Paenibacillus methanolicus]
MQAGWAAALLALLQLSIGSAEPMTVALQGAEPLVVERADYALPGVTMVDLNQMDQLIAKLSKKAYVAPTNAYIAEDGRMIAERKGRRLDERAFTAQFYRYFYGEGAAFVEAPLRPVAARVDRELLAAIRRRPIGYYVTYFNPRNHNRAHNIALAAKAINNAVVFPGEKFSFNKVVGRRTKEKGYLEAPVIVRGELSEGVGGGICQVSSTLFNATDRAGLEISARYSHSRSVPYVRPGRDATVSWDGPDFVFRNPYNQPVLVRANAVHGKIYVVLYSSDEMEFVPREVPGMNARELPEETPAAHAKAKAQPLRDRR